MYPRNAASPERIYLGPVIQISDGAVQTSGVAVTVTPQGGSETSGGGTIAYSTKGGVWYTPTQAETNHASVMIEASKTGCIPAGVTVVTTASSVAGYAAPDWAAIRAPTTTVNLSGTTVKTATDVETDTADIQSRLPVALVSGRMDASVGAMATDVITSTAMAASAVTEIQSGLSTLDAAGVRTAVGLASANLDTQLGDLPTATENADALLNRDMSAVSDTNARSPLNALRAIRNKWGIAGTTYTVRKEDDTTTAWTAELSSSAAADPVTGSDPA